MYIKSLQLIFGYKKGTISSFTLCFQAKRYSFVLHLREPVRTYPMKIGVRIIRHIVIEYNVNPLNVHTTTKEIGSN